MKKNLYAWMMLVALILFTSSCGKVFVPSKEYITQKVTVGAFEGIEAHSTVKVIYSQVSSYQSIEVSAPDNMMEYVEVKVKDNTLIASLQLPKMGFVIKGDYKVEVRISAPAVYHVQASSASEIILEKGLKTPNAVNLEASSAANIKSGKIICRELSAEASSSGNIIVKKGQFQNIEIEANSAGNVNLMEMRAEVVEAEASSAGNVMMEGECIKAKLTASSAGNVKAENLKAVSVQADASSAGNVFCHATEALKAEANSAGNVRYKGEPKELVLPEKGGIHPMD